MSPPRILVAGVGNIFLGDDGFGVAVVRRLMGRVPSHEVKIVDFGIRGIDLAYALLDPYELVILVDVLKSGSTPGSVHVLELDHTLTLDQRGTESHGLVPTRAIELARTMGARIPRLILVGCEPAGFGDPDEGEIALSPAVTAAIDGAIEAIDTLLAARGVGVSSCTNLA